MIHSSPKRYEVPALDLLTFLFDSHHCSSHEDTIIHCEAANPSNSITKSQARDLTQRIAFALRNTFGIGAKGPGKDVVVTISSGQPLLPILFYGVIAAGGVYSAASSTFTAEELARQIQNGSSNLIFCSEDARDVAIQAATVSGVPLSRVVVAKSSPNWSMLSVEGEINAMPEVGRLAWRRITNQEELDNSLICLLYSSGTTGVLLSHTNMVAEGFIPSTQIREHLVKRKDPFEYRTLAHLPAAHIAGVQGYFVNPMILAGIVYWMPKFDFAQFLGYMKQFRITFIFSVPPIYLLISKMPQVTDQFDTLEHAISGAAPLGKELQHSASLKLGRGKTFISQTWGLSETTGSATIMPWGENDDTGSVSKLFPNTSARFVDDDGNDVEDGQPGEVLLHGPVVSKGYYNNPRATAATFTPDGWVRTGDIGLWKNGLPYIVDRKKELIKYNGIQVAPAELEALLLTHPLILDAAVIGVSTESTEVPRGYVVRAAAAAAAGGLTERQVQEWVKARVSSPKQLRGGVKFVDVIPKSASGKILRKDLREGARREEGAKL